MGILGWLLVGLLADGTEGVGWNNVGKEIYLGVVGQGVTGLSAKYGYVLDWSSQMKAQLLGTLAIVGWGVGVVAGSVALFDYFSKRIVSKNPIMQLKKIANTTTSVKKANQSGEVDASGLESASSSSLEGEESEGAPSNT